MRLPARAGALLLAATLSVAFEATALADGPSAAQVAQAEDLFQRAKTLMAKKQYDEACPMLAESYKLAGGGGTLQNLAICYEEAGKFASAYNRFAELRSLSQKAHRVDRVKLAEAHIAKIEPRLSRIRIRVSKENRVPDMEIRVDDDPFGEGSWDAGVLVDQGAHVITVAAPGRKTAKLEKNVDEGTMETVEVPRLVELPKAAVVAPPPPPPSASTSLAELDHVSAQRALRSTGFVVGGIGIATLAAGGVFGVLTITTNNAAKKACEDNTVGDRLTNKGSYSDPSLPISASGGCFAPQAGQPQSGALARANGLRDDARTFANVANVLIPVGVIALGIGTYLVIRSSDEGSPEQKKVGAGARRVRASLAPAWGGLSLSGTFQ